MISGATPCATYRLNMLRLRAGTRVFRQVCEFTRGLHQSSGTPEVVEISLSEVERHGGRLGPRNLQKALESLHRDGIVMLKDVVNHDHLDVVGCLVLLEYLGSFMIAQVHESPLSAQQAND